MSLIYIKTTFVAATISAAAFTLISTDFYGILRYLFFIYFIVIFPLILLFLPVAEKITTLLMGINEYFVYTVVGFLVGFFVYIFLFKLNFSPLIYVYSIFGIFCALISKYLLKKFS